MVKVKNLLVPSVKTASTLKKLKSGSNTVKVRLQITESTKISVCFLNVSAIIQNYNTKPQ